MMISRLILSNYRSLGAEVRIPLGRFVVLVGPNGSGKSNVVDALRFVADAMTIGLPGAITHRQGIDAVRRWTAGHPYDMSIQIDLDLSSGPAGYSFKLTGNKKQEYSVKSETAWIGTRTGSAIDGAIQFTVEHGQWREGPPDLRPSVDERNLALPLVGGDARFKPLADALRNAGVYEIFPDTLRAPQKYNPQKPMDRHGSNWASILKEQPEETWKSELLTALQKLTKDIDDVRVSPAAGFLVVEFHHDEGTEAQRRPGVRKKWFGAAQESDGTLRFAGIVTALLQDPALAVVAVEEPELTVHPGAIPLLYDYLVQAATRSQVIVTTHSPELLDLVRVDDVRVVTRGSDGTRVLPMLGSQKDAVRAQLVTLGEVLRTEGVQGDLGLDSATDA